MTPERGVEGVRVRSRENGERLHTDLEFSDYLRYKASAGEIRAGVESWLREAVIAPFSYNGVIENGVFKAFDQGMVEMARHGLEERVGQVGQARAEADLAGVIAIEKWLRDEAESGDVICLLSPPGSEAEGFGANGQRRLSFTQFGVVNIEAGRREIKMVSIPEKEVSIKEHVWRVNEIWGDYADKWLREVERTDKGLVASPLFIPARFVRNGLDEYVRKMGKEGWGEIEEQLEQGLALKEDDHAEQRRKSLIGTITWQVLRYVEERDSSRLNNIGLVARVVMAREAAGKYLNWDYQRLLDQYEEIESAMWFKKNYAAKNLLNKASEWVLNGAEAMQAWKVINRLQGQLREETDVREMLMGSSCGGGGIDEFMSGRFGLSGNYLDSITNRALGLQEDKSTSVSTESMKCVKCPFCKETVDAEVTSEKITCPKCHESANRG